MMHRIPPYFALIIRAISVLEGIALTGDPDFAIVDEAYPYVAKRLLTDNSPRLQEALRYMVRPCAEGRSSRAQRDQVSQQCSACAAGSIEQLPETIVRPPKCTREAAPRGLMTCMLHGTCCMLSIQTAAR